MVLLWRRFFWLILGIISITTGGNDDSIDRLFSQQPLHIEDHSIWENFEIFPMLHCPQGVITWIENDIQSPIFSLQMYTKEMMEICSWEFGEEYLQRVFKLFKLNRIKSTHSQPRLPAVVLMNRLMASPPSILPLDNLTHIYHHVFMNIQNYLFIIPQASFLRILQNACSSFSIFLTDMTDELISSDSIDSKQWAIAYYDLMPFYDYIEYTLTTIFRTTMLDINYHNTMNYTFEQYNFINFPWNFQHLSFALIIDTPCLSGTCKASNRDPSSPYQPNAYVHKLLEGLRDEIDDIKGFINISIYYGYAYYADEHEQYEDDCKLIQAMFFPIISKVFCVGKVMVEIPDSMESRRYEDIRESMASDAYDLIKADYYWCLDLVHTIRITNPMIMSTLSSLYYNTLMDKVGVGFQHSYAESSQSDAGKLRRDVNFYYPFSPMLTSEYFKMKNGQTRIIPFAPKAMNNYLWLEMFDLVGSVKYCDGNFIKQFHTPLFSQYQEYIEAYILQLIANKNLLLEYLQREVFTDPTDVNFQHLFPGDDSLFTSKVFQEMFCAMYIRQELVQVETIQIAEKLCVELIKDDYMDDEYEEAAVEVSVTADGVIDSNAFVDQLMLVSLPLEAQIKQYTSSRVQHKFNGKEWEDNIHEELILYPSTKLYNNYDMLTKTTRAKVAVITAIFGGYEKSFKAFAKQSIPTDFICFTDMIVNKTNNTNGWIINRIPYHLEAIDREIHEGVSDDVNAFSNNPHPFNIAKYYKTSFQHIPFLQSYDVVIWIDGTVRIHNEHMTKQLLHLFQEYHSDHPMITFEHIRKGELVEEYQRSVSLSKYSTTEFSGFKQPVQDIDKQYHDYIEFGYSSEYWKTYLQTKGWEYRINYGVWCTCFLAFNMKDARSKVFLSAWTEHIRKYSTQDQVSFSFLAQHLKMHPYPLPDNNRGIRGSYDFNTWFNKILHGK